MRVVEKKELARSRNAPQESASRRSGTRSDHVDNVSCARLSPPVNWPPTAASAERAQTSPFVPAFVVSPLTVDLQSWMTPAHIRAVVDVLFCTGGRKGRTASTVATPKAGLVRQDLDRGRDGVHRWVSTPRSRPPHWASPPRPAYSPLAKNVRLFPGHSLRLPPPWPPDALPGHLLNPVSAVGKATPHLPSSFISLDSLPNLRATIGSEQQATRSRDPRFLRSASWPLLGRSPRVQI